MATGCDRDSVADAAARWLAGDGISAAVRDARRWDLCVLARIVVGMVNGPQSPPEGPSALGELRRLGWADLDSRLLSEAVAAFEADHAPVTTRRLVATWSSFLEWLREGRYPVPRVEAAPLTPPKAGRVRTSREAGPVVAEVIRSGRHTYDAWPERDTAMVGVIIAGSLSLTNVSMLRVRDVHRHGDRTWLQTRDRHGRTRDIELPPEVHQALDEYLASRRTRVPADASGDLFVRARTGKPYTPDALRYLYVGWFKRAGLGVPREPPATALLQVHAELMRALRAHEDTSASG